LIEWPLLKLQKKQLCPNRELKITNWRRFYFTRSDLMRFVGDFYPPAGILLSFGIPLLLYLFSLFEKPERQEEV